MISLFITGNVSLQIFFDKFFISFSFLIHLMIAAALTKDFVN